MAGAFALRGQRLVSEGRETPGAVLVRDGRIEALLAADAVPPGVEVHDVGEAAILPGLVDSHVHVNEPGRSAWEGFATATRAAAAGGVTTLVDMPLNSDPVTTTRDALLRKRDAAAGQLSVDCAFWGGLVPGNAAEIPRLLDAGAAGVKAFLVPSGIEDFPAAAEADLRAALPILAERGAPLIVHAELPEAPAPPGLSSRRYLDYLASRPASWEERAVFLLVRLVRERRTPVHVVHLAAAAAARLVAEAQQEGLPLSAETCPHYLALEAESVPDGRTEWKCAPPLRGRSNREALWRALGDGTLSMVVSDHSPCPPEMKLLDRGDFGAAWGGIASLQLSLPVVWSEASARGFGLCDVARWMSREPARLAGLGGRKGRLAPGYDADLVVFDPDARFVVEPAALQHRHKLTPYAGRSLRGRVRRSFVRGRCVYDAGSFPAPAGVPLESSHGLR
jgi:allantoinase